MDTCASYLEFGCKNLDHLSIITSSTHIFIGFNKLYWVVIMETYLWSIRSIVYPKSVQIK